MSVNTLVRKIRETNNPTVAGLDARLEYIPAYNTEKYTAGDAQGCCRQHDGVQQGSD